MLFLEAATTQVPTINEAVLWAIPAAPLAAFVVIALYVRKFPIAAGWLTAFAVGLAMVLAYITLVNVIDADGGVAVHSHRWFTADGLEVNLGVRIDGLAAVMLIVVTTVSFFVQLFSQGYMAGDAGYGRYFGYMCLFTASMLGLVLADNLFMIFIFWELVGLCSYLLIGFWYHRPSAAAAAKKAFIVTRIGDLGLLVALFIAYTRFGTFDVTELQTMALAGAVSSGAITALALGIFSGAVGKSAQFPLHVWLPDAMEGPTPVSALIHAATMVAAGVYLVARFFPIYEVSHDAAHTVAWIGAVTALIGATIALVQTDFKRVLAYSTISQLGYMIMALGVFGYAAAIFHLFTHAFFKSLLFLGSGSVNHRTNTFDMRKMGGLKTYMPITFWTFVIASLSISGIFPFAGFWSKDEILLDASRENWALWVIGAGVALLTSFYMFRAIFLTFFGEYKGGEPVDHADPDAHFHGDPGHPHESGWVMVLPLLILSVPAIAAGWLAYHSAFGDFIEGALPEALPQESTFAWSIALSSTALALGGIGIAWAIYYKEWVSARSVRFAFAPFAVLFENKWYFDRLYEDFLVRTVFYRGVWRALQLFDGRVVDGVVNGVGAVGRWMGGELRQVQNGQVQTYAWSLAAGVVIIVVVVFAANPL